MALLLLRFRVQDYGTWKPIFDERHASRMQHGAKRHWVYRSADDGNDLTVSVAFPTVEAARAYATDSGLREAMARAGVQGEPEIVLLEEAEDVSY